MTKFFTLKRLTTIFAGLFTYLLIGSSCPKMAVDHHFAISLAPNYGDLTTFAICSVSKGKVVRVKKVDRKSFVAMVGGKYESSANPTASNLFAQYKIPNCYWPEDTIRVKKTCPAVDNLWKLRYQKKPGSAQGESSTLEGGAGGWAAKERAPSASQLDILKRYGIDNLNDFAMGQDVFRLMIDIQDPSWQAAYR